MDRTVLTTMPFTFVYRMLWNTEKWGYAATSLRYHPGAHYRYEVGYMFFPGERSMVFTGSSG